MMVIRKAEYFDIENILALLLQIAELHHKGRPDLFKSGGSKYTYGQIKRIIDNEATPIFVAIDEVEGFLGYAFCVIEVYEGHTVLNDRKTLFIDDFCVRDDKRGMGVGKGLFESVKKFAKDMGCYNIDLYVWEFNEEAISFYEKLDMKVQKHKMELILD